MDDASKRPPIPVAPDDNPASTDATKIDKLLRQQAAIARFGTFSLREWDLSKILNEAVRVCAEGLDAPFSKVCRHRPEQNDLLIVAGYGWQDGVVGHVVSRADMSSPQGRAFSTGTPAVCDDLKKDRYFDPPAFYAAHGIVSTIDVVIRGSGDQPYGILEIDNNQQQDYDQYDVNFLTGFANVLAEAVATASRARELQDAFDRMKRLAEDKERLLQEKNAVDLQMRQAQKMEAVGQLTGGLAHDLNNILTVISGTIEILAAAVADRPQLAAIAKMIDEAAVRGAELTQRLLAFARKQPLHPRAIDVNALIVEATNLLRPTLGDHITLVTTLAGELSRALIDPGQLTNTILNLALNARDSMPEGGEVSITTRDIVLDASAAAANELDAGSYVLVAVGDSGHGIPADILPRVFEPFFTTKDVGKGSGLGLSMVYGFVKQSNGHVVIESVPDHGTTVTMLLPQATGVAQPQLELVSQPKIQGGTETILVVEDDDLVRRYVIGQIESLGYATLTAANAAEALVVIDSAQPIDLLFTDMTMPGALNGRQLAVEARRRRPALSVLFSSGFTEESVVHDGHIDAEMLFLAKPYRKADLARMIRVALTGTAQPQAVAQPGAPIPAVA
ncbi:ATP-binding protein [Rhodopseudomonas palustris]|uniref:histidine kinase n=1 Tax=Rhodopseudomonas palustris (strain BisB18) TaxID=316056 RepID=Q21CE5_RHOPB